MRLKSFSCRSNGLNTAFVKKKNRINLDVILYIKWLVYKNNYTSDVPFLINIPTKLFIWFYNYNE